MYKVRAGFSFLTPSHWHAQDAECWEWGGGTFPKSQFPQILIEKHSTAILLLLIATLIKFAALFPQMYMKVAYQNERYQSTRTRPSQFRSDEVYTM